VSKSVIKTARTLGLFADEIHIQAGEFDHYAPRIRTAAGYAVLDMAFGQSRNEPRGHIVILAEPDYRNQLKEAMAQSLANVSTPEYRQRDSLLSLWFQVWEHNVSAMDPEAAPRARLVHEPGKPVPLSPDTLRIELESDFPADLWPFILSGQLADYSMEEIITVTEKERMILGVVQKPEFRLQYAIYRSFRIQRDSLEMASLLALINEAALRLAGHHVQFNPFLAIAPYLSPNSPTWPSALQVLAQPALRSYLNEAYGFRFSEEAPQNLEDVIRAHPDMGDSFLHPMKVIDLERQMAFRLMHAANWINVSMPDSFDTFVQAMGKLLNQRGQLSRFSRYFSTMSEEAMAITPIEPRTSLLTAYDRLRREFTDLAGLCKEIFPELAEAASHFYPTSESFWASSKSLLVILGELTESSITPQHLHIDQTGA